LDDTGLEGSSAVSGESLDNGLGVDEEHAAHGTRDRGLRGRP
jgi:hypothetical protein